ncbi:hypothetical protein KM043_004893 [Ampulex compressa]|nr:hypothetical protein KM043_004893 [Ampulex compressa]
MAAGFWLCRVALLLLTYRCDCAQPGKAMLDVEAARYCDICADHTMCLFPSDDFEGHCVEAENEELDERDIGAILMWHNVYRNKITRGEETRGNPGPQPAAKFMMELIWDDELARIASRWAMQCNRSEKDRCRNVGRFEVWQNVNTVDVDEVGSGTSTGRIEFHIQSWYDDVEQFDAAEVG